MRCGDHADYGSLTLLFQVFMHSFRFEDKYGKSYEIFRTLGRSRRSGGAEQGRQVAANDAGAWRRAGQHGTPHGHMDQRPPTRCGLLYYYMKY